MFQTTNQWLSSILRELGIGLLMAIGVHSEMSIKIIPCRVITYHGKTKIHRTPMNAMGLYKVAPSWQIAIWL
jgi:hypothetical protein